MRNWRMPLNVASILLIGLGLLISGATAASVLSETHPIPSPIDPIGNPGQSSKGFAPIIIPELELVDPGGAPTLVAQTSGLSEVPLNISSETVTPASPPIGWNDPAASDDPSPTSTSEPNWIPDRIVIPSIDLDAPVILASFIDFEYQGQRYQQWKAPDLFAAGQLITSAPLGVIGNTVLVGHHNEYGEVFAHLVDLQVGDLILVYSGNKEFTYTIALKMILPERNQPMEVRTQECSMD